MWVSSVGFAAVQDEWDSVWVYEWVAIGGQWWVIAVVEGVCYAVGLFGGAKHAVM